MHIDLQDPSRLRIAATTDQLLAAVTTVAEEINKQRPLPDELANKLRDTFLPDRIVGTLNIEGITATRRQTLAVMDALRIHETVGKGEQEIANALRADEFVTGCCDREVQFSEGLMREINKYLIQGLRDDAGIYRPGAVALTNAHFTPPEGPAVPGHMEELARLFPNSESLHPIVQAAWLHNQFTYIHPFNDGNGRTGRLLQDWALVRRGLLPVGVNPALRDDYYEALESADKGEWDALIELIADMQLKMAGKYQAVISEHKSRSAWVAKLAASAAAKRTNARHKQYLVWRTRVERIAAEFQQACTELSDASDVIGTSFKDFGVTSFQDWESICKRGYSERSWIFSIMFYAEGKPFYKTIAYIKRHIPQKCDSFGERRDLLAIYFTGVEIPETIRPDFHAYDDPYICLREILPFDSDLVVYRDNPEKGELTCDVVDSLGSVIEEFYSQAFQRKL